MNNTVYRAPTANGSPRLLAILLAVGAASGCTEQAPPPAPVTEVTAAAAREEGDSRAFQERYLYVTTVAQSSADPDFIAVVGADPRASDFGRIVNRIDMPNVGDELHHFGYSVDRKRLIVPGLFSNRMHVFQIEQDRKRMTMTAVSDVASASGYAIPHGVMAMHGGHLIAPMIGAASGGAPGGIVQINDRTGAFESYFGPGPVRDSTVLGPRYMYDFAGPAGSNRAISTTFGPPALCGGGIDPTCLGDEVAVWNLDTRKVIQVAKLGAHSGALQMRFIEKAGVRRGFINTPGTSTIWLTHDDDKDGDFEFQPVLDQKDGLLLPADILLSPDGKYLYVSNWFGNTVQQFDISDPFHPVQRGVVQVPHPNMLRLSRDSRRLYVTNSLITTWDNDPDFGPPRNKSYGIWLFQVDPQTGSLTPSADDGKPWVSFGAVRKKNSVGPAGPHMMLFDPSIKRADDEH